MPLFGIGAAHQYTFLPRLGQSVWTWHTGHGYVTQAVAGSCGTRTMSTVDNVPICGAPISLFEIPRDYP